MCFLASNEVHFVSLAENLTVQFSKVSKLPSGMENILTGPVITGSFEKRAPGVCIWTCVLFCVALGYVYVVLQC